MIFNGTEKEYIRVRMELFRPPTPPIEFNTIASAKGGSRVKKKRFTDATLPVPIRISSDRRIEELEEEMSAWLVHDEPKKLVFSGTPNRYYLAYYENMDLNIHTPYYATGYIYFYLPEAYRFGERKEINVTTSNATHTITGQTETPWSIQVNFTVPQSRFEIHASNGLNLQLNYSFIAGDVLQIDYVGRKVTLNGNDLRSAVSMSSNFVELDVGEVRLRAIHVCTLKYDEKYL
ncbi:distal tail protein Dit [Bacillus sp. JCM 19034]|uniref:distal tail protein Dit n=1 Tax=Bacillus sp. JCM 19034 TaxID=1481928 RepID=UPI00078588DD|nr:distal tail protein Dit [Bacillus sp. JCM 19034]